MDYTRVDHVADDFLLSREVRLTEFTRHRLFTGDFQTIKSRVAIETCWRSIYHNKRASILLLRNIDADYLQMSSRIKRLNYTIGERFGSAWRLPLPKKITQVTDEEIEYSILTTNGGVLLIGLCNVDTIRRLNKIIGPRPKLHGLFNLTVDEGDLFCFDIMASPAKLEAYLEERTKTEEALEVLYSFANSMHTVTATPYPVYCSRDLESVTQLSIIPPTVEHEYYGFERLLHIPVDTRRRPGKGYHYNSDRAALDKVFKVFLGDCDARMLVNPGPYLHDHDQIVAYIRGNHYDCGITVVVHNDIEIKVYLPPDHPSFAQDRPYLEPSYTKPARGRDAVGIADVIQTLKDEHDSTRYRHDHIVIVAGNKAGRGISFVSDDYGWHLTHLYMVAAPSKHSEGLLQGAARLCGMYSDKPVLKLFMSQNVFDDLMHDRQIVSSLSNAFQTLGAGNLRDLRTFYDLRTAGRTDDLADRVRLLGPGVLSLLGRPAQRGLTARRKDPARFGAWELEKLLDRNHYAAMAVPSLEEAWKIAPDAIVLDGFINLTDRLVEAQRLLLLGNLPNSPENRIGDVEALDHHLMLLIAADLEQLRHERPDLHAPDVLEWKLGTRGREDGYKIRWDQHRTRKRLGGEIIRHELHLSKVRNLGGLAQRSEYRRLEYFESHAFVAVSRDHSRIGLIYRLWDWPDMLADPAKRLHKWTERTVRKKTGVARENAINRLRGPFVCHTGAGQLALYLEPGDVRQRTKLTVLPFEPLELPAP